MISRPRFGLLCALVPAFALLAPPSHADRGGFEIRDFTATLTVHADASLDVTESITVEFFEPRHGIYRMIPVRYTDPRGFSYGLDLRLEGVEDGAGRSHKVKVSRQGPYVRLRIGDPDREVTGSVAYVVRYRVDGALPDFPEHDELYWNVTGNEWPAPIHRAEARVILPGAVAPDDLRWVGFTGRAGSREREARLVDATAGRLRIVATRPLEPFEGLTVAVAWPKGLIHHPGTAAKIARFLSWNWILLVPPAALLGLILAWRRLGRDPAAAGPIVVRYEPPPGALPAEVGVVVDEKADLRDLTAMIVDLAARGFLTIQVDRSERFFGLIEDERVVFRRNPDADPTSLTAPERAMLEALFSQGNEVSAKDLENHFYKFVPGIRNLLYDKLVQDGYFAARPTSVRRLWVVLGAVAAALTFAAGAAWNVSRGGVPPQTLAAPAVAAVLVLILFLFFSRAMPRRTRKGVRLLAWARGFEEFVERVEKPRLEAAEARQVFERLLPFAMALGVSAAWARKFEGIYATSGTPGWFVGLDAQTGFSTRSFESSLSRSMEASARSLTAAPRSQGSSGFGGGGFSGGGGGGGGGGSW